MSIFSKIFGKSKDSNQLILIRALIGSHIVRGDEIFDCNSISDEILIGLPESTIITVIASYFDLKYFYPNLPEDEIFKKILRERHFSDQLISKILDKKIDLLKLTKLALAHSELGINEDQSGFLSDAQILAYIEKYKKMAKL